MGRINVTYSIFEGPSGPNNIRYFKEYVSVARLHYEGSDNRITANVINGAADQKQRTVKHNARDGDIH